jgi:hypothetical protein
MNLVERAKDIVLTPKTEWPVVSREGSDVSDLFVNYVAILAAIPAICGLIGGALIGLPLGTALGIAITGYVLSFLSVYVIALIVDQLAPQFGGRRSFDDALKLTVYSATPIWLSGVFLLLPRLRFLSLLGLIYAVYLLWGGIPPLMRAPADRALVYTAVIIFCLIVVFVVFNVAVSQLIGFGAMM